MNKPTKKMKTYLNKITIYTAICCVVFVVNACKTPALVNKPANTHALPTIYGANNDTSNIANISWRNYFTDSYLKNLIDTALNNNQELWMVLQEIEMTRNEISARKGEYLPFVNIKGTSSIDKVPRYTNIGAMEANTEIRPGKEMPDPLPNFGVEAYASWELDIWHKLHNATKASTIRYLATVEGKNFVITNLVAEVANLYYELLALDNQLAIVRQNIELQTNVLAILKAQKEAAKATELAVRKFEAEVLNTKSLQYNILQNITETENKINFLLGRYPQPIPRDPQGLDGKNLPKISIGLPAQLLALRPDIRQAEQNLAAFKLDVNVAKAQFYPTLGLSAGLGYGAYSPAYFLKTPESILMSLAGDVAAPLINKNAIKVAYLNANAKQIQAAYNYEKVVLNAFIEVSNQWAKLKNLDSSYALKSEEVKALTESIDISTQLYKSARADYMEVLLTQRDALDSRFELIETRKQQMNTMVNIYRAVGGGWQ